MDYRKKEVTIRFSDHGLNKCSGVMPVEDDAIEFKWERSGNQLNYSLKVPSGFKVKIENPGSLELKNLCSE